MGFFCSAGGNTAVLGKPTAAGLQTAKSSVSAFQDAQVKKKNDQMYKGSCKADYCLVEVGSHPPKQRPYEDILS